MKRSSLIPIAAAAAAISVLAALTGCSTSSSGSGTTTLKVIWDSTFTKNSPTQAVITQFEKDNPGVKVDVISAGTNLASVSQAQLVAGTAPDVLFGAEGDALTYAKAGYLAPLDDTAWAKSAVQAAKDTATYDGHVYMVVPAMDAIGAIYNTGTLKKYGLSVPTTWDELLDLCRSARDNGIYAFGAGFQEGWTAPLPSVALLASSIRDIDSYNKAMLKGDYDFSTSSAWKSAFDKQTQLIHAQCFNPSPNGTSIDTTVLPGLNQAKYLGVISVGAHIGVLTSKDKGDPTQSYTLRGLPVDNTPDHTNIQAQPDAGLMVNKKSKNLDLAMKFVEAWGAPAALNKYADDVNATPSIPNPSFTPKESIAAVAEAAKDGHLISELNLPGGNLWSAQLNAAQGIFAGTMSNADALKSLTTAYAKDTAAYKTTAASPKPSK